MVKKIVFVDISVEVNSLISMFKHTSLFISFGNRFRIINPGTRAVAFIRDFRQLVRTFNNVAVRFHK